MAQMALADGKPNEASPSRAFGRLTGLLYLVAMTGIGLIYGYSRALEGVDEAISAVRSTQNQTEFFIAGGAFGLVCHLLAAVAFYRLFEATSRTVAALLVMFVALSVPLSLAALANMLDIISLNDKASGVAPSLSSEQLQVAVTLALTGYNTLILMAALFWGLWLIPLGYLLYRSRVAPRVLGLLLIVGSLFYLVSFAGSIFMPGFERTPAGQILSIATFIPAVIGELGAVAWLIIFGGRRSKALRGDAEHRVTQGAP